MISEIFLKFFSIFLLLAVGVVLILGIGTLFKGGNASKKYSIEATPTIFINEKKYNGQHNYEDFKKEILKFL